MAEHHVAHTSDNDYVEHEKTYNLFLTLTKWGALACVVIVLMFGSATGLVPWLLTLLVAAVGGFVTAKI